MLQNHFSSNYNNLYKTSISHHNSPYNTIRNPAYRRHWIRRRVQIIETIWEKQSQIGLATTIILIQNWPQVMCYLCPITFPKKNGNYYVLIYMDIYYPIISPQQSKEPCFMGCLKPTPIAKATDHAAPNSSNMYYALCTKEPINP